MSAKKFKFVSPGIFINEIDNSQLPRTPEGIGPIIIGRSERGPAMRPVRIESFSEFVEMFGNPISGGRGDDVFRTGNYLAPTYAAYAAQAWLKNQSPLTFVRLLGVDHVDGTGTKAGWKTDNHSDNAGAFGLFIADAPADPQPAFAEIDCSLIGSLEDVVLTPEGPAVITEKSGTKPAAQVTVSVAGLTGAAPGGNIKKLTISIGAESRSYTIGADGAPLIDVAGLTSPQAATAIATYIGNVDDEFMLVNAAGAVLQISSLAVRDGAIVPVKIEVEDLGGEGLVGLSGAALDTAPAGAAFGPVDGLDSQSCTDDTAAGFLAAILAQEHGDLSVAKVTLGIEDMADQLIAALGATVNVTLSKISPTVVRATRIATGANTTTCWGGTFDAAVAFAGGSDTGTDFKNAALAAIIYNNGDGKLTDTSTIGLTGTGMSGATVTNKAGVWVKSVGDAYEFQLNVSNAIGATSGIKETININFDPKSEKYIRKVLNTNPTLCQLGMTDLSNQKSYWLGESFDRHLQETLGLNGPLLDQDGAVLADQAAAVAAIGSGRIKPSGAKALAAGAQVACLVELSASAGVDMSNHVEEARAPRSGWVISQHLGKSSDFLVDAAGEMPETVKLFRLHGLYSGEWDQKNLKISIEDIKPSTNPSAYPYGTFTLSVRRSNDTDKAPAFVERYTSLSLDPNSTDYISNRIGDMETYWVESERRYRTLGQYENNSQFVRVEVNPDLDAGLLDPVLVPFGFYGAPKVVDHKAVFGAAAFATTPAISADSEASTDVNREAASVVSSAPTGFDDLTEGGTMGFDLTGAEVALRFPKLKLRKNSRDGGLARAKDVYWGIEPMRMDSATRIDPGYGDYVCSIGAAVGAEDSISEGGIQQARPSYVFSLDNIQMENAHREQLASTPSDWAKSALSITHAEYLAENSDGQGGTSAQRAARGAASARRLGSSLSAKGTYEDTLKKGFNRFTMPMFGGQDGLDLREKEPFRNSILDNQTDLSHYAFNSIKRAIDACADPEVVECNIMTMPGINNPSLTDHLIGICEARADALAIIDLPGDYTPNTENTSPEKERLPNVEAAILNLKDRVVNSSYGCAYFPWVQIRDSINNALVWAPPSVVALGTMSNSQRNTALWFAPAGFTRGGLSNGGAGIPVINVRHRLNSEERDALYEANINPIASFPAEGIVVFGQKTLQVDSSALDRINVRRLMIYLKKEISRMAATVLFDQNVAATWGRFTSKVNPFLNTVKSQFGLSEYKVILDETTTTPDLIDRNVMYAKIMLKPTRAIEYIAIDFVITDSGASFDD